MVSASAASADGKPCPHMVHSEAQGMAGTSNIAQAISERLHGAYPTIVWNKANHPKLLAA